MPGEPESTISRDARLTVWRLGRTDTRAARDVFLSVSLRAENVGIESSAERILANRPQTVQSSAETVAADLHGSPRPTVRRRTMFPLPRS